MMNQVVNLPCYFADWLRYRNVTNDLFWFKKYSGMNWIKGQNFGDYLSLVIVGEIALRAGLNKSKRRQKTKRRLFAVGSILHFAKNNDVIWGSGVNGKIDPSLHTFNQLEIRMLRGPKTKSFLKERGIYSGNVFGDPGLLLSTLFPEFKRCPEQGKVIVLPNMNELELCRQRVPTQMKLVSPFGYWKKVLSEILSSELVLTSSLHGVVVAESFGVPVRFVMPVGGETLFKYQDYFLGTGRSIGAQPSSFYDEITIRSGIDMERPIYDSDAMLKAFPKNLFE